MMKSEFENLLGYEVDIDEYEKIETVYMQFDNNEMPKKKIAELYKNDSSFVTDTLYGYITRNEAENVERLKGINNMQRCIDDLRKDLKNACETIEKMVEDNGRLQEVSSWANKKIIEYIAENDEFKTRVEELETQLHQYKALFADMEKNATVSLYKTLLGVTE